MYKLVKFSINSAITSLKIVQFCLMLFALLTMIDFIIVLIGIDLPAYIQNVFNFIYNIQSVVYKPNLTVIPVDFTLVVAAIEMLIMAGFIVYVLNFIIEFEQVLDKVQKDGNRRYEKKFNKQLEQSVIKFEQSQKQFAMLYDISMERVAERYAFDNKPVDIDVKIAEYRALFRTQMSQNFSLTSQQLAEGGLLFFNDVNECNAVFNKIYEFSKQSQETLKQLKIKFRLKIAICIAGKNDKQEVFVPKLKKLLNIAVPNKIMALGDFKGKYETLKEKPYKISGMGEYSIDSETIDVYTLEP